MDKKPKSLKKDTSYEEMQQNLRISTKQALIIFLIVLLIGLISFSIVGPEQWYLLTLAVAPFVTLI